jgi:hypothetical protein
MLKLITFFRSTPSTNLLFTSAGSKLRRQCKFLGVFRIFKHHIIWRFCHVSPSDPLIIIFRLNPFG